MRVFVTGAAGFIGSNMVDRLLADGHEVVGYDNLSTGRMHFLAEAQKSPRFMFEEGDILEVVGLVDAMNGADLVTHFAANADVRHGTESPRRDLAQNTFGTSNVLEAMRINGVERIVFASTGSVYGDTAMIPTPEDAPFPVQTSLYAASKLAGEALISAYCEGFGFQGWIFRFVSILGERYSHGHVFDFVKALNQNQDELQILGNGLQRKSYLHVGDCIDAILLALRDTARRVNIYNLGTDASCTVLDSVGWITERLGVNPGMRFTGGARGWIGDSPHIHLDCSRIKALGWSAKIGIREGVERTVDYLQSNPDLLAART